MQYFVRRPWDLPHREITEESAYHSRKQHRREFLQVMGIAGIAGATTGLIGCGSEPTLEDLQTTPTGRPPKISASDGTADPNNRTTQELVDPGLPTEVELAVYPAERNDEFQYGRDETPEKAALQYTNFYEFSQEKSSWQLVRDFKPRPWTVEIDGLCDKPMQLDLDDIAKKMTFEERAYRHRCVETWAMCVPWTGFELAQLIQLAEPKPSAKYVRMETVNRPDEMPGINATPDYPWPYAEGLTIEEAMNKLTFIATGIYGKLLPKQNGSPLRLVTPWKYGFKCIKSIVKITLTAEQPKTFWNTLIPERYGFTANVDPQETIPWPQNSEWMLGTNEGFFGGAKRYPTEKYNGYGEYVAKLYVS